MYMREMPPMSAVTHPTRPSTFARLMRRLGRSTAPISRPLAGRRLFPLWALLHHRGRRSGRAYATPVAIRASNDAFTIALPWGTETQWLRNVLAAGGCTIRWRGTDHRATDPRVIGATEAADAFNPIQRAILRAVGVRSFLRLRRADP